MNQIVNLNATATLTMSSREIAELTKKNHADVLRDVRVMLAGLGDVDNKFAGNYVAANGKRNPEYQLPKRETLIRVVQIDGQPWFAAPDVCRALEMDLWAGTYKWLVGLAPDEKRLATASSHPQLFRGSKARSMSLISESGLYKLIMRSDKPEARKFQDWVTREVLPAIRKDGLYVAGEEHLKTGEMSDDELTLMVMERLRGKIERLKEEKAAAEAKVEQLTGPALVGQITTTRSRKLQLVVDMLPFVNKNMVSSRLMELEQAKPKVLVGETTEIRVARFTAWSVRAREYAVAV